MNSIATSMIVYDLAFCLRRHGLGLGNVWEGVVGSLADKKGCLGQGKVGC